MATPMRKWFNAELKKFAPKITGSVLNVGAGDDKDNEGSSYHNYFIGAKTYYTVDAYRSAHFKYVEQAGIFDTVLSFWVLEHVFNFQQHIIDLKNACSEIIIIAVPTKYPYHPAPGDYWRFTREAMEKLLTPFFDIEYISEFDDGATMGGIFIIARKK